MRPEQGKKKEEVVVDRFRKDAALSSALLQERLKAKQLTRELEVLRHQLSEAHTALRQIERFADSAPGMRRIAQKYFTHFAIKSEEPNE